MTSAKIKSQTPNYLSYPEGQSWGPFYFCFSPFSPDLHSQSPSLWGHLFKCAWPLSLWNIQVLHYRSHFIFFLGCILNTKFFKSMHGVIWIISYKCYIIFHDRHHNIELIYSPMADSYFYNFLLLPVTSYNFLLLQIILWAISLYLSMDTCLQISLGHILRSGSLVKKYHPLDMTKGGQTVPQKEEQKYSIVLISLLLKIFRHL